jgi:hypothetical protein
VSEMVAFSDLGGRGGGPRWLWTHSVGAQLISKRRVGRKAPGWGKTFCLPAPGVEHLQLLVAGAQRDDLVWAALPAGWVGLDGRARAGREMGALPGPGRSRHVCVAGRRRRGRRGVTSKTGPKMLNHGVESRGQAPPVSRAQAVVSYHNKLVLVDHAWFVMF